ncbi:hypothetical protein [Sideroxydans lithotrophicus]|uniref:Uncharacterized protein n=1 Tax=Sideroxydans lithotrophicus (strain ES-1) TaxID=580332 RepID=D5CPW6_SIDLE|nr:hypothetical protein [Sideroxydans lithotrophicus]ADE11130.1 hypothetical protein Slit_0892 [Sideroxydans lithotrophicus ES-1]
MALLLLGCKGDGDVNEWKKSSVAPIKPGSTVVIRVVHATNPRLPQLSPDYLKIVLASAQLTVWKNFGVNIEFTDVPEMNIDQLFALIPPAIMKERMASIFDFKRVPVTGKNLPQASTRRSPSAKRSWPMRSPLPRPTCRRMHTPKTCRSFRNC